MPGSVPVPLKVAPSREQKRRAAASIEFFGMSGKITKRDPGTATSIRNGEGSHRTIDNGFPIARKREQPRVAFNEVRIVRPIGGKFLCGAIRVCRTEQNNQLVARKARRVDPQTRRGADFDVRDSKPELD